MLYTSRCLSDAPPPSSPLILSGMCRRCPRREKGTISIVRFSDAQQKVSELSVKSVFGLHRRERIACATFHKRGQKVSLTKLSFCWFFDSFPTWAQEGQTGQRRVPKGAPIGLHWEFKAAKCVLQNGKNAQRLSQTCHKVFGWPRWVKNVEKH